MTAAEFRGKGQTANNYQAWNNLDPTVSKPYMTALPNSACKAQ